MKIGFVISIMLLAILFAGCLGPDKQVIYKSRAENNTNSINEGQLPVITSYYFGECNSSINKSLVVDGNKVRIRMNVQSCLEPKIRMNYTSNTIEMDIHTDGKCCSYPAYITLHNLGNGNYTMKIKAGNKTTTKSFVV